jgi:hypothetical protein
MPTTTLFLRLGPFFEVDLVSFWYEKKATVVASRAPVANNGKSCVDLTDMITEMMNFNFESSSECRFIIIIIHINEY